jgi:hypothetical protein
MKIRPVGAELFHAEGQTHMTKLIGDFCNSGKAPKKETREVNDVYFIFQYIANKMQIYTVYSYLETALHVSGGTSTHHQERIQLYLRHLLFVTPLLPPAANVEELSLQ